MIDQPNIPSAANDLSIKSTPVVTGNSPQFSYPAIADPIEEAMVDDILYSLRGRNVPMDTVIDLVLAARHPGAELSKTAVPPTMLLGYPGGGRQDVILAASEKVAALLGLNFLNNPGTDQMVTKNDFVFTSMDVSPVFDQFDQIAGFRPEAKDIGALVQQAAGVTLLFDGLPDLIAAAEKPGFDETTSYNRTTLEKVVRPLLDQPPLDGLYLCATNNQDGLTDIPRLAAPFNVIVVPTPKFASSIQADSSGPATVDQLQGPLPQTMATRLRRSFHATLPSNVIPNAPSDAYSVALLTAVEAGHKRVFLRLLPDASADAKTAALKLAGRLNNTLIDALLPVTDLLTVLGDLPYFSPAGRDMVASALPLDILKQFVIVHGDADLPATRRILESARLTEFAANRLLVNPNLEEKCAKMLIDASAPEAMVLARIEQQANPHGRKNDNWSTVYPKFSEALVDYASMRIKEKGPASLEETITRFGTGLFMMQDLAPIAHAMEMLIERLITRVPTLGVQATASGSDSIAKESRFLTTETMERIYDTLTAHPSFIEEVRHDLINALADTNKLKIYRSRRPAP